MLKRKISFVTYTIIITALILVVGISCLLVIQNNLMKDDMNLMAYKKLTQEVAQIRRYIVYDSQKKPHIDDFTTVKTIRTVMSRYMCSFREMTARSLTARCLRNMRIIRI